MRRLGVAIFAVLICLSQASPLWAQESASEDASKAPPILPEDSSERDAEEGDEEARVEVEEALSSTVLPVTIELDGEDYSMTGISVSYTHLTLPTIYSV